MSLEKKVLDFFEKSRKFHSIFDLQKQLEIPYDELENLKNILLNLEQKGKIYCENNEYIHMANDAFLKFGILKLSNKKNFYVETKEGIRIQIDKKEVEQKQAKIGDTLFIQCLSNDFSKKKCNYGIIKRIVKKEGSISQQYIKTEIRKDFNTQRYYVLHNQKKIFIKNSNLKGAFVGDLASILLNCKGDEQEGKVVDILERKNPRKIFIKKGDKWLSLENLYYEAQLDTNLSFSENDLILATYSFDRKSKKFHLNYIKRMSNDLKAWIDEVAINYNFSFEFPNNIQEKILNLSILKDYEDRVDLRALPTFTIDPPYAKDLDDAVSIEKKSTGYRLYVHIADVDYYAPFESDCFVEAIKRGTSCYPSHYVIPQLPSYLSDGLCSLNEQEDKLAKTMVIDVDFNGKIVDFQIFRSLIRSDKKMSYDKVNLLLEKEIIEPDYLPFQKKLLEMNELSAILQTRKLKRGYLYFFNSETQVELNEKNVPIGIKEEQIGTSNRMIENFMLLANEAITEYSFWLNLPFVYRNHQCPSVNKMVKLKNNLQHSLLTIKKINGIRSQKSYQKYLLNAYKNCNNEERKYISQIFLSSMERAYYSSKCEGHFGLALEHYGTFTSPIRRGSDLINHAVLSEFLANGIDTDKMEKLRYYISSVTDHLSEREIAAESFELEVQMYLLEKYVHQFLEYTFNATIEFMTEEQIYIRTTNNIKGIILVGKNDYVDKTHHLFYSQNKVYKIGDSINVLLVSSKPFSSNSQLLFEKETVEHLKYSRKNNNIVV